MGTAKGNDKYYKKPEDLLKAFEDYKEEVKANPRIKVEYVGKDGLKVETPIERPLTIAGFKTYCAKNGGDIQAYWVNRDEQYNDYSTIITRIREEIREEQIDGGMTGFYNPNITARLNGLSDKKEIETSGSVKILNVDPLADD